MASGFTKLGCLGRLRISLPVSLCLAKDVVALGFSKLCCPGNLSLRPYSFITSGPSFFLDTGLLLDQMSPILAHCQCFLHVSTSQRLAHWASLLIQLATASCGTLMGPTNLGSVPTQKIANDLAMTDLVHTNVHDCVVMEEHV